jgi:RNA polymerase sigma factor (sigma-70 family)
LRAVAISKFDIPACDVDELIHDVFITYLRNPSNIYGDPRRYLLGGVCNASRNYWRTRRTREHMFSDIDEILGIAEANEDILRDLTAQSTLKATLSRLPSRCREALCRYYLDEEDTSTIAAALETSRRNVNYIVHVCRKRARAIYDEISRVP